MELEGGSHSVEMRRGASAKFELANGAGKEQNKRKAGSVVWIITSLMSYASVFQFFLKCLLLPCSVLSESDENRFRKATRFIH